MARVSNWPAELAAFIEAKRNQPFDWHTNNCGFFACDWLRLLVAIDPAEPYRQLTPTGLVRLLKENDLSVIATAVAGEHGWAEVSPLKAQRGDIIEMRTDDGPALGVCDGARSVFAGKDQIIFVKTSDCARAWRIT